MDFERGASYPLPTKLIGEIASSIGNTRECNIADNVVISQSGSVGGLQLVALAPKSFTAFKEKRCIWVLNCASKRWRVIDLGLMNEDLATAGKYSRDEVSSIRQLNWFGLDVVAFIGVRGKFCSLEMISRDVDVDSIADGKSRPKFHRIILLPSKFIPKHFLCCEYFPSSASLLCGLLDESRIVIYEVSSICWSGNGFHGSENGVSSSTSNDIVVGYNAKVVADSELRFQGQINQSIVINKMLSLRCSGGVGEHGMILLAVDNAGRVWLCRSSESNFKLLNVVGDDVGVFCLRSKEVAQDCFFVSNSQTGLLKVWIPVGLFTENVTEGEQHSPNDLFVSFGINNSVVDWKSSTICDSGTDFVTPFGDTTDGGHQLIFDVAKAALEESCKDTAFCSSFLNIIQACFSTIIDSAALTTWCERHMLQLLYGIAEGKKIPSSYFLARRKYCVFLSSICSASEDLFMEVVCRVSRKIEPELLELVFPVPVIVNISSSGAPCLESDPARWLHGSATGSLTDQCSSALLLFEVALLRRRYFVATRLIMPACEAFGGLDTGNSLLLTFIVALELFWASLQLLFDKDIQEVSTAVQCLEFCSRLEKMVAEQLSRDEELSDLLFAVQQRFGNDGLHAEDILGSCNPSGSVLGGWLSKLTSYFSKSPQTPMAGSHGPSVFGDSPYGTWPQRLKYKAFVIGGGNALSKSGNALGSSDNFTLGILFMAIGEHFRKNNVVFVSALVSVLLKSPSLMESIGNLRLPVGQANVGGGESRLSAEVSNTLKTFNLHRCKSRRMLSDMLATVPSVVCLQRMCCGGRSNSGFRMEFLEKSLLSNDLEDAWTGLTLSDHCRRCLLGLLCSGLFLDCAVLLAVVFHEVQLAVDVCFLYYLSVPSAGREYRPTESELQDASDRWVRVLRFMCPVFSPSSINRKWSRRLSQTFVNTLAEMPSAIEKRLSEANASRSLMEAAANISELLGTSFSVLNEEEIHQEN